MSEVIAEVKDTAPSNITLEDILTTSQPKNIAIAVCGGPETQDEEYQAAVDPYVTRILAWGGDESRGVLNVTTVWANGHTIQNEDGPKEVVVFKDPTKSVKYLEAELRLQLNVGDGFIIVRSKTDDVGVEVK